MFFLLKLITVVINIVVNYTILQLIVMGFNTWNVQNGRPLLSEHISPLYPSMHPQEQLPLVEKQCLALKQCPHTC